MQIQITDSIIKQLEKFKSLRKFDEIECYNPVFERVMTTYVGAPDEDTSLISQNAINDLTNSLLQKLPTSPFKKTVLDAFEEHLEVFGDQDTEEREQAGVYCEKSWISLV